MKFGLLPRKPVVLDVFGLNKCKKGKKFLRGWRLDDFGLTRIFVEKCEGFWRVILEVFQFFRNLHILGTPGIPPVVPRLCSEG